MGDVPDGGVPPPVGRLVVGLDQGLEAEGQLVLVAAGVGVVAVRRQLLDVAVQLAGAVLHAQLPEPAGSEREIKLD